jgi:hypothetical protein
MPNGRSQVSNLELNIPTYLPLSQAAHKYDIPESVLTQLIHAGKIEAVRLPSGELLVSADDSSPKTKEEVIADEFAHLCRQKISASEASRKYSKKYGVTISHVLFSRWARAGYINVIDRGYRLQMDEADVAYCAKIYAEKFEDYDGQMTGVTVFDEDGNPYQLKYPEIAAYKRTHRRSRRDREKTNGGSE